MFSEMLMMEMKDACYYKVKASAKVWPSAYASGRLVQCRKKGAGNYGNKSEGVAEDQEKRGRGRPPANDQRQEPVQADRQRGVAAAGHGGLCSALVAADEDLFELGINGDLFHGITSGCDAFLDAP
jgi:hypothetical protein